MCVRWRGGQYIAGGAWGLAERCNVTGLHRTGNTGDGAFQVSRERIEGHVRTLAATPRHREAAPEAHARAAEHIARQFEAAECRVSRQEFPVSAHPGRKGLNLIGTVPGSSLSLPAVLIGAHYDTRPASPGADDNASGVAAMLECARALAGQPRARSVVFIAFDAEERQDPAQGLWGSSAYVRSLQEEAEGEAAGAARSRIGAAFVLEMVGYSAPPGAQRVPLGFRLLWPATAWRVARRGYTGDFLVAVSRGRGNRLARMLSERAGLHGGPDVLPLTLLGWLPLPKDLLRTDHAPFWAAGVPAVMVGDTASFRNPNYHLPSDTPDTVDYGMVAGLARALAETVAQLAAES